MQYKQGCERVRDRGSEEQWLSHFRQCITQNHQDTQPKQVSLSQLSEAEDMLGFTCLKMVANFH